MEKSNRSPQPSGVGEVTKEYCICGLKDFRMGTVLFPIKGTCSYCIGRKDGNAEVLEEIEKHKIYFRTQAKSKTGSKLLGFSIRIGERDWERIKRRFGGKT
jgi:hypothetical protein